MIKKNDIIFSNLYGFKSPLIEEASKIKCPVLFIRGDQEPRDLYPAEEFQKECKSSVDIVIIENSNHFYLGAENTVRETIRDWLNDKILSKTNS